MVFTFELETNSQIYQILAPQTAHENAQIIEFGFPSDVWFDIAGSKSLPVYVRQPSSVAPSSSLSIEDIPQQVISQTCDILKHQANAKRDVNVKYTFVSNLSLNGPKNASLSREFLSKTKRSGPIASPQLVATQKQKVIDFEMERAAYDKLLRAQSSEKFRRNQKEESENSKIYKAIAEQKNRGYSDLFADEDVLQSSSNQNRAEDWEDDFM